MEFMFTIFQYFTIILFTLGTIWKAYRFTRDSTASSPSIPYASSSWVYRVDGYYHFQF